MMARSPDLRQRARQRGAAALEFQIISFMVLVPLFMAVLQMGLLMIAKNTLNVAALGVARAGAASGGSMDAMKHAFRLGIMPLEAGGGKYAAGVGMSDITSANYHIVMPAALARAALFVKTYGSITVLNPTAKSFHDFGVDKPKGKRVIPVTNLVDDATVGKTSQQTRADALLLKIEVRYCQELAVPIINDIITGVLSKIGGGASFNDQFCYAANRIPITSQAVVRMTVAPVQDAMK